MRRGDRDVLPAELCKSLAGKSGEDSRSKGSEAGGGVPWPCFCTEVTVRKTVCSVTLGEQDGFVFLPGICSALGNGIYLITEDALISFGHKLSL